MSVSKDIISKIRKSNCNTLRRNIEIVELTGGVSLVVVSLFGYVSWLKYEPVSLRQIKLRIQDKLRFTIKNLKWDFTHKVRKQPVYTVVETTDCDMCTSTSFVKYENGFEYIAYQEDESNFEWLEGPYSENFISEEEYLEYQGQSFTRDRIMEAYENGNGNSVVV